jgi:protein TonB
LKDVELLQSSGHRVLDDAAIRIVRLAAPFAPFPDELRQTTDVLEIIRTWQFKKNSSLRSF